MKRKVSSPSSTSSSVGVPPSKKTCVQEQSLEDIDTNVCCVCFSTYEEDVLEGAGADWIACTCGRWLHEECVEDCVVDASGNERYCPLCNT